MEFKETLNNFVEGVQAIFDMEKEKSDLLSGKTLKVEELKRYIRISTIRNCDSLSESVFCFIDKTNGDVLKPASWRGPAKWARGNIFNEDNGLGSADYYGIKYRR